MTPEQIALVASAVAAAISAAAGVASAVFALVAIRTQRASTQPRVRVSHTTIVPTFGAPGMPGASVGDAYFAIVVNNTGILPVTVSSAGLATTNGGTIPFIKSAIPGGGSLPARLEPGEEVMLVLDTMTRVANTHVEAGPAKWARVSLGSGASVHGPRVKSKWLAGWAKGQ